MMPPTAHWWHLVGQKVKVKAISGGNLELTQNVLNADMQCTDKL